MSRPPRAINLVGQKFGRLTVLARCDRDGRAARWICRCDCGNECISWSQNLRNGRAKSCGCRQKEAAARVAFLAHDSNRTHGKTGTPEWKAWRAIIDRCTNPNIKHFPSYGGRGVTICSRWRESFANFLTDMGDRPSKVHSIDRIDNDGNYEPSNCRWATKQQQDYNKRTTSRYLYKGEEITMIDAERISGLHRSTLQQRLHRGWTISDAIERPTRDYPTSALIRT